VFTHIEFHDEFPLAVISQRWVSRIPNTDSFSILLANSIVLLKKESDFDQFRRILLFLIRAFFFFHRTPCLPGHLPFFFRPSFAPFLVIAGPDCFLLSYAFPPFRALTRPFLVSRLLLPTGWKSLKSTLALLCFCLWRLDLCAQHVRTGVRLIPALRG